MGSGGDFAILAQNTSQNIPVQEYFSKQFCSAIKKNLTGARSTHGQFATSLSFKEFSMALTDDRTGDAIVQALVEEPLDW